MEGTLRNRVQRFIGRLAADRVNLHGFILSVNGQEKAKAYYAPFREGQMHRMYSVSKTMVGLAIGMLVEEGKLSLDQPVTDFFQDLLPEKPDERLLRLTIRDMLRMATCYERTSYREGVDEDWTRPFFTDTPSHEPGTVFHYDTGCSQVLSSLVRRLSGEEVIDFLNRRLFGPLGCRDPRKWLRDPAGQCQGGTGLCMSLRDLHTVSRCLMEGGRGLIPSWYIREMTRKQIGTLMRESDEERWGYGWQCWQTRAGWAMYGMGGQMVIACPEQDALLCTIADTRLDNWGIQKLYNAFFEEIVPGLGREDMEPETWNLRVLTLQSDPSLAVPAAGPFFFEEGNPLGMKTLALEGNRLCWENACGKAELAFVPGGLAETGWPGRPEIPAHATAGWTEEPGLLRLQCHAVGDAPCGFEMLLLFRKDSVTLQARRSYDPVTEGYEGVATGRLRG